MSCQGDYKVQAMLSTEVKFVGFSPGILRVPLAKGVMGEWEGVLVPPGIAPQAA